MNIRPKKWFQEVFGGGFRAAYFWTTTGLTLLGLVAGFLLGPRFRPALYIAALPLLAFLVGFIYSNVDAFSRAVARAESAENKLTGLSLEIESASAGEHIHIKDDLYDGPVHHHVVIDVRLMAVNRDGQNTSSIQLLACNNNLEHGQLDQLYFVAEVHQTSLEKDPRTRVIANGAMRPLHVIAVYSFSPVEKYIEQTNVNGSLRLRDNRGTAFDVPFSASLIKNPIRTE